MTTELKTFKEIKKEMEDNWDYDIEVGASHLFDVLQKEIIKRLKINEKGKKVRDVGFSADVGEEISFKVNGRKVDKDKFEKVSFLLGNSLTPDTRDWIMNFFNIKSSDVIRGN